MNNLTEAIDVDRGEYVAHANFTAAEAFPHLMQQQPAPKEQYSVCWDQHGGQRLAQDPNVQMRQLNYAIVDDDRGAVPVIERSVQVLAQDVSIDQWSSAVAAFQYMGGLKSQGRRQAHDGDRASVRFKYNGPDPRGNCGDKWIATQTVPVFELSKSMEKALASVMDSDETLNLAKPPVLPMLHFMLEPTAGRLIKAKQLGIDDMMSMARVADTSALEADDEAPAVNGLGRDTCLKGKCMATALVTALMRTVDEDDLPVDHDRPLELESCKNIREMTFPSKDGTKVLQFNAVAFGPVPGVRKAHKATQESNQRAHYNAKDLILHNVTVLEALIGKDGQTSSTTTPSVHPRDLLQELLHRDAALRRRVQAEAPVRATLRGAHDGDSTSTSCCQCIWP